ncbi:benzoate transporter [Enterobacter sp. Bisph1]|uniref:benzoate transporter n=1 Tax=Enterobacter sp. Bisph1 TaxID=1274399 RepID=UPI00057BE5FE|nr:benzoate transporter [Enterobacter sp. Bisph1]
MIYDCFLYYDEDMLLDIRLNTLVDVVDRFVIVESTHTFTGKPRKLHFDIDKFSRFKDKIIYVVHDEEPIKKKANGMTDEVDAWANEAAQRNAIMQGLNQAQDDDLILVSDVDEIFSPDAIRAINPKTLCTTLYMGFYNYQFNLQVFNPDGSKRLCKLPRATTFRNLKGYFKGKPEEFRNIKKYRTHKGFISKTLFKLRHKIMPDAGWHFSWIMKPERISEKMSTISHTEYDLPHLNNREHIINALTNAKDIWGRDRKMVRQDLTKDKFPAYLVDNAKKFEDFII